MAASVNWCLAHRRSCRHLMASACESAAFSAGLEQAAAPTSAKAAAAVIMNLRMGISLLVETCKRPGQALVHEGVILS